jgi:hypothetical protein
VAMPTDRGRVLTHDPHDLHRLERFVIISLIWMWQCITNVPR